MIYGLFRLLRVKPDKNDALNIYTAMLTDTGSFRHSNTGPATLHICAELLKLGVKPAEVYGRVYENNSPRDMDYVAKLIPEISFSANNRILKSLIRFLILPNP
jgi:phosphoesterase RecJ-like protein